MPIRPKPMPRDYFELYQANPKLKDFLVKFKEKYPSITNSTATSYYYKLKKGTYTFEGNNVNKVNDAAPNGQPPQQDPAMQPQNSPAQPPKVTEIKPNEIRVEADPVNPEAEKLSELYKGMANSQTPMPDGASQASSPNGFSGFDVPPPSSPQGMSTGDMNAKAREMTIKLHKILYTVGVSLNDNLIWANENRALSSDEKVIIDEFSSDLQTTYAPNVNDPNAPIYNWVTSVFILPAVARMDLIPKKVEQFGKWLSGFAKKGSVQMPTNTSTETPKENAEPSNIKSGDAVVPEEKKPIFPDMSRMSDAQREWITTWVKDGKKVSPNFNPMNSMDVDAMRRGILRNFGDNYE